MGHIEDILDAPLSHSILVNSADSTVTNPLIIWNNLGYKIFGGEHTVICVIGMNEDTCMGWIYLIGELGLYDICCIKCHLIKSLDVTFIIRLTFEVYPCNILLESDSGFPWSSQVTNGLKCYLIFLIPNLEYGFADSLE